MEAYRKCTIQQALFMDWKDKQEYKDRVSRSVDDVKFDVECDPNCEWLVIHKLPNGTTVVQKFDYLEQLEFAQKFNLKVGKKSLVDGPGLSSDQTCKTLVEGAPNDSGANSS